MPKHINKKSNKKISFMFLGFTFLSSASLIVSSCASATDNLSKEKQNPDKTTDSNPSKTRTLPPPDSFESQNTLKTVQQVIQDYYSSVLNDRSYQIASHEKPKLVSDVTINSSTTLKNINKMLSVANQLNDLPRKLLNNNYFLEFVKSDEDVANGSFNLKVILIQRIDLNRAFYDVNGNLVNDMNKAGKIIKIVGYANQNSRDITSVSDDFEFATNEVPVNSPYEFIHKLSFSLQFNNSGGYNASTEAKGEKRNDDPYGLVGTGWLFDYEPLKNNSLGKVWTGYFATNLHVAEGLLNPNDNALYQPPQNPNQATKTDTTQSFLLRRYDSSDNSLLSSVSNRSDLTSVRLQNIPKTMFAATNFTQSKINGQDPYIDFAVLQIKFQITTNALTTSQIAENAAYSGWILPATRILDDLKAKNESLFDLTNYTESNTLNQQTAYLGGYPSIYPGTRVWNSSNRVRRLLRSDSSLWTINSNSNETDSRGLSGQRFDLENNEFLNRGRNSGVVNGMTNNLISQSRHQVYHGNDYKGYGVGYAIENSNLGKGSSGSALLNQDNKIMGIYWGTISRTINGIKNEVPIGLADAISLNINPNSANGSRLINQGMQSYNLITGAPNMTKSYRQALSEQGIKTLLFS
ncbi:MIP family Ig-specific serine endopeptidase [[Mycoplasma] testudinis]|uniref:MIP family Ig-specific serine endopeptidase n=1 Tax=[Mycoplasma] testudinis TaxID=33924 RepID=UPI0004827118|nr:DUF31 family protein [[Mycoplasma] testudinis]